MLRDKGRDQTYELQKIHDTYRGKMKTIEDEVKTEKKRLENIFNDQVRQLQVTNEHLKNA